MSVVSGVFVVLKAGSLELILFVLSFPRAVILRLVRLLILGGFGLQGALCHGLDSERLLYGYD